MARIDYDAAALGFEHGRGLSLAAIDAWRDTLTPFLSASEPARILDLGSGTGVFAWAFAQWFDVEVIGIEPSAGMREQARLRRADPRIAYIGADGEHIPLRPASCDAAWLSTVIHHIPDLPACAMELRRVLHPEAPVLIRSAFPGRTRDLELFRWFPGAARVVETFPSVDATIAAFASAGFTFQHIESVPQTSAPGLPEFAARARLRADTTLLHISDDEFAAGLSRLDAAAAAEREPRPIIDRLELLVLK